VEKARKSVQRIVIVNVVTKIESELSALNKLRAMARPRSVEWEIADPINAFFLAIKSGEIRPHVIERKSVPKMAYNKKS
jgi:hypothetical protein